MKRLLISTAAVALMSSGAFAADLPIYEPPAEVVPVATTAYDWSGFYVGLHVGGAFLTEDDDTTLTYNGGIFGGAAGFCTPDAALGITACPTTLGGHGDDGFLAGGGHAGFQGQWGMWVAGIEADITYLDLDDDIDDDDGDGFGNHAVIRNPSGVVPFAGTFDVFQSTGFNNDDEENNLLGTVRGKLGVAFDRVLVYGTGGLALTSTQNTEAFVGFRRNGAGAAAPFAYSFTEADGDDEDDIALGFAVGGGIDVAVTDNFIVGVQALYFNVEGDDDDNTLTCNPGLSTGILGGGCAELPAGTNIAVGGDNEFEGVLATVRGSYKFNLGGGL